MFKIGDKVRVKTREELTADPNWKYDPFMHRWEHINNNVFRQQFTGMSGIIKHFDEGWPVINFPSELDVSIPVEALASDNDCECSKDKFDFEWHEKWCPAWRPII